MGKIILMVKIRGYKLVVIVLLILLSVSCFLSLIVKAHITFKNKSDDNTNSIYVNIGIGYTIPYTDDDTDINNLMNNYQNNSIFVINSNNSFKTFIEFLGLDIIGVKPGNYQTPDELIANDYFLNKTVYLTCDINMTEWCADQFNGTFDGNRHTLTKTVTHPNNTDTLGLLFRTLNSSGVIRDLKLSDCEVTFNGGSGLGGDLVRFGGLVGENKGTIEQCVVTNLTYKSNRYADVLFVAPIAGVNNGVIKNCLVNGTYTLFANDDNGWAGNDGMHAYYFRVDGADPINSVYQATVSKTGAVSDRTYAPEDVGEKRTNGVADSVGSSNYNSTQTAKAQMASDVASSEINSNTPWYLYEYLGYGATNEYYVYPRVFITWSTIYFNTDDDGDYEIIHIVPSDCLQREVEHIETQLSYYEISGFFGSKITHAKVEGKDFDEWQKVSNNHYSAIFVLDEYGLIFFRPTFNNEEINVKVTLDKTSTNLTNTVYSVTADKKLTHGDDVEVLVEYSENSTKITYTFGEIKAIYTIDAIYYVESYGQFDDNTQITESTKVPDFSNYHNIVVVPTLGMKSYGSQFN